MSAAAIVKRGDSRLLQLWDFVPLRSSDFVLPCKGTGSR